MLNRRALFSFFAALPFVGVAKARGNNLLSTAQPYLMVMSDTTYEYNPASEHRCDSPRMVIYYIEQPTACSGI